MHTFCEKMTSEIMITSLCILGSLLVVGVTSYMRNRLPYEIFYYLHHMVFIMFALAIAHTIDDMARAGQVRSQTFKWFAASLIWYLTDRAYMAMMMQRPKVEEWSALGGGVDGKDKGKVVVLRLRRPALWTFKPGHFAFINLPGIDFTWHPFSVASEPTEPTVDFFIEVAKNGSWTDKLWHKVNNDPNVASLPEVRLLGPYGTDYMAEFSECKHIVAVGSGTGIVPMVSLLKSTFGKFSRINAENHKKSSVDKQSAIRSYISEALKTQHSISSLVMAALRSTILKSKFDDKIQVDDDSLLIFQKAQISRRNSLLESEGTSFATYKGLRKKLHTAQWKMLLTVMGLFIPTLEFTMGCLAVSWSVLHAEHEIKGKSIVTPIMQFILFNMHAVCVAAFAISWILWVPIKREVWFSDAGILVVSLLVTVLWQNEEVFGHFEPLQRIACIALAAYRMARVWTVVALPDSLPQRAIVAVDAVDFPPETFKLVFACRSASFVQHLWPELNTLWCNFEAT